MPDQTVPYRNYPKQKRSRERFDHILNTAAEMFAQQGYETVTTNHIAAQAEVSIGSLYRFFPNKEAILHALVERYQHNMGQIFPQDLDPATVPYEQVIETLVATLMQFDDEQAAFQHILVNVDDAMAQQMHGNIVRHVKTMIGAYYPQLSEDKLHLCATVGVGIVKGIMPLKDAPDLLDTDAVQHAMTSALLAYLRDFLTAEGIDYD